MEWYIAEIKPVDGMSTSALFENVMFPLILIACQAQIVYAPQSIIVKISLWRMLKRVG